MSKSALASLTAQYTDSDNEDRDGSLSPDSVNSQASQVIIPQQSTSAAASPAKRATDEATRPAKKSKKLKKKSLRRLVSYQDDTYISDEEDNNGVDTSSDESSESSSNSVSNSDSASSSGSSVHSVRQKSSNSTPNKQTPEQAEKHDSDKDAAKSASRIAAERAKRFAHYKFSLPPEPKGKPAPELVEKIRGMYEKMKTNNMDMNRLIQDRKDFRNPSIYEKLIQFCDINEFGTNYPPEIYDPLKWGKESYYEELAAVQQTEMTKRQKMKGKEVDKIDKATALARKVEEEAKKRKSKWDQPAKPVQALTTTVTGTKGTVISAFGSLPKKPTA